jgi:hypothetical protein
MGIGRNGNRLAVCWQLQLFCKVGFVSGFVCLANVLQCAVGCRDFALNVLSLEGERNFQIGLRTTAKAFSILGYLNYQILF